jgi:hypothetical protein
MRALLFFLLIPALRDGQVTSESKFVYANFHKFQTSSGIKLGDVP